MKPSKGQRFQIVVRALVFRDEHLLVSQWRNGYAFPVGGKLEFGESLHDALLRELYEETGARGRIAKLLYFGENFWRERDREWHEHGWYYAVETEDQICDLSAALPNPDHPDLYTCWTPIWDLDRSHIYPTFLTTYLHQDYEDGFRHAPRHILTDQRAFPAVLRELTPFGDA